MTTSIGNRGVYHTGKSVRVWSRSSPSTLSIYCTVTSQYLIADKTLANLLLRALANRTRERNYFRLYAEMLDGVVSEEYFDKELSDHPERYVVEQDHDAGVEELSMALGLSRQIPDVEDADDLARLFSFKESSMLKQLGDDKGN